MNYWLLNGTIPRTTINAEGEKVVVPHYCRVLAFEDPLLGSGGRDVLRCPYQATGCANWCAQFEVWPPNRDGKVIVQLNCCNRILKNVEVEPKEKEADA